MQFFMIPFSNKYPKLRIIRNANNLIEISVNDKENLKIEIESSMRDVLTIVIRSLLAKCPTANLIPSEDLLKPMHNRSVSEVLPDPLMKIDSTDKIETVSACLNKSHNSSMVKSVENSYEVEEPQEEVKVKEESDHSKTSQNEGNADNEEAKSIHNQESNIIRYCFTDSFCKTLKIDQMC
jgi:hypothetical protein